MRRQVHIAHSACAELLVDSVFGVENFADHRLIQRMVNKRVQPPS
jgi:hypothetical protein